jgi:cobalt-precorrin 5A hydrolase/precorrin-3B C17-methyltransferase
MARLSTPPAFVILGAGALPTARRLQACFPGAQVHGLAGRVAADVGFAELGAHLRELYASGTPIVALCAAGIVIRCLAPLLANKGAEPPVLAVAEDGSAVVPLLGGLAGVNTLARELAAALEVRAAITTSGELRFGACLLDPPPGYALASLAQGKRFVSDLLAGESTRVEGDAPWLDDVSLPRAETSRLSIVITPMAWDGRADQLVIHPRSVVAAMWGAGAVGETCEADDTGEADEWGKARDAGCAGDAGDERNAGDANNEPADARILRALEAHGIAPLALAALVVPSHMAGDPALARAAARLGVPLRLADAHGDSLPRTHALLRDALRVPYRLLDREPGDESVALAVPRATVDGDHSERGERGDDAVGLAMASAPVDAASVGRARGRLTVLGLGPGSADLRVPAAHRALAEATDIVGYATYVEMAGPLRADQRVHRSDNREELQRARDAFELASAGRRVVVVSSGDPGVFAMAAAVLEALDHSDDPAWGAVELDIVPGISAAMATAALAGAPLGHDFCMLSLSDNLKPWAVIEKRLRHAAEADLVIAFYNPVSRARPWQLDKALDIVRCWRGPTTRVVLGRDVGRPGGTLRTTTLGELRSEEVDMRTMVIVGSSTTRAFTRGAGRQWVYTPRWYPGPDVSGHVG